MVAEYQGYSAKLNICHHLPNVQCNSINKNIMSVTINKIISTVKSVIKTQNRLLKSIDKFWKDKIIPQKENTNEDFLKKLF